MRGRAAFQSQLPPPGAACLQHHRLASPLAKLYLPRVTRCELCCLASAVQHHVVRGRGSSILTADTPLREYPQFIIQLLMGIRVTPRIGLVLWTLCSVPLVSVSVLVPVASCVNNESSVW